MSEQRQDDEARKTARRKHLGNYIWLSYSLFFFVQPVLENRLDYWLKTLGIFAVFVALYVWYVETRRDSLRLPLIQVMILLGAATIDFNLGASFMFIFAAALVPFATSNVRTAVIVMVGESALIWTLWLVERRNGMNFAVSALFTLAVGTANLFVAEQKRADARLQAAQQENVQLAAVAERERIARDLHDVLGHTLSVIVLKAELAGRLLDRDATSPQARVEIGDVEHTARTALAEVREAIGGYRARGLTAEVENARRTLSSAGVALTAETENARRLNANQETALSLALREAVTNIVRHAHATECTLRFGLTPDGQARLEVADNGSAKIDREGNGLRGMRERVEQLGGRLAIEQGWVAQQDANGLGTRLIIELPTAGVR